MPIFRIVAPLLTPNAWYEERPSLKDAKSLLPRKDPEARAEEWRHCLAPQHGEFPDPEYMRAERRRMDAVTLRDGTPYCALCLKHALLTLEEKVERLERAIVELQCDFVDHEHE